MMTLAISALVAAVLVIFVPLLGGYLSVFASLMAVFVRGRGFYLAMAASIINLVNVLFLSPILRINAVEAVRHKDYKWGVMFIMLGLLHAGAGLIIYFRNTNKNLKKPQSDSPPRTGESFSPESVDLKPMKTARKATPDRQGTSR